MNPQVVCFGAAHVDFKAQSLQPIALRDKNPVRTSSSFGGVGRNIAENLARLGVSVAMVSRVGQDAQGDKVLTALGEVGINASHVSRSLASATATYTALLEPSGEMYVALSDMAIYDEILPDIVSPAMDHYQHAPIWIVDTNLPETTLRFIASRRAKETALWAVGVSVLKTERLWPILPVLDLVIVNEDEFSAMQHSPKGTIIVTKGANGVTLYAADRAQHFAAPFRTVVDVTGAGDAFCAGLACGYLRTADWAQSVSYGIAAAGLTLGTTDTVRQDLDFAMLASYLAC